MTRRLFIPILSAFFLCGSGHVSAAKVPTPPSNLTVKPVGVNAFELKWKDNSDDETGWEIRFAPKGTKPKRFVLVRSKDLTAYTLVMQAAPGKEFDFQISAYKGEPEHEKFSAVTSIVTAKALGSNRFVAPSKLKATAADDGKIQLIWKDNATSETGYQIDYKGGTVADWLQLTLVPPGTSFSVPVTGFIPETGYTFRVRAYSSFGGSPAVLSDYSNEASVTTKAFQAPSNLVVTSEGDGAFTFKWKDKSSAEAGFEIQQKIGTADFTSLGTTAANENNPDIVTGFAFDTNFQFKVRGFHIVGGARVYSAFTNTVAVKSTNISKPYSLAGSVATGSSVTLAWKSNSARANGYDIDYREVGTDPVRTPVSVGKVLTSTVTGLAPGKLYEFRVRSSLSDFFSATKSGYTEYIQVRTKDGISGEFHPPIFMGSSFLYTIQVSRVSELVNLTANGLPAGLVLNSGPRTITGTATEEGVKSIIITATFSDASVVTRTLVLRIIRPPGAPVVKQAFAGVNVLPAATATVSVTGKFEDPDTKSAARLVTTSGNVDIILYTLATPATVTNFLSYLNNHSYDNGFFHRSVTNAAGSLYIVQGGGYQHTAESGFTRVTKAAAIQNEPGISNLQGTIAMAKIGGSPNSATSEFFVNLDDVNAGNLDAQNEGFTVFGRISTPSLAVMQGINALNKKNYNVLIGTGTQFLEDVPITSPSTAVPINPALLVKVPSASIPPVLTYEAVSQNPSIAGASFSGSDITITGVATGNTTIQVKATDLDGQTVTQDIPVSVP